MSDKIKEDYIYFIILFSNADPGLSVATAIPPQAPFLNPTKPYPFFESGTWGWIEPQHGRYRPHTGIRKRPERLSSAFTALPKLTRLN